MNPILQTGTLIVNVALISYAIGIVIEQRKKLITKQVLTFLTIGVFFDVTATCFMVIGSSHSAFSSHGLLGYSSLLAMSIDCILLWRLKNSAGLNVAVPRKLHLYSRIAFIWWILAYITGGLIVALRHMQA